MAMARKFIHPLMIVIALCSILIPLMPVAISLHTVDMSVEMPRKEAIAEPHLGISSSTNVTNSSANETTAAVETTKTFANTTSMPKSAANAEEHFRLPDLFGYSGMLSLISVYWYIKYRKEMRRLN
jgi:hypothetical protein